MKQPVPPASPSQKPAISLRYAWYALVVVFVLNMFMYANRYVLGPMVPLVIKEFHLSHFRAGLLNTAFMVVYSVVAIPIALLADRWMRNRIIAIGAVIWSLVAISVGFVQFYWALFAALAGLGLGEGAFAPCTGPLLSDYFPFEKRATALSISSSAMGVGTAVGIFVGGLLGPKFGWRIPFVAVGLPGLVLFLFAWFLREPAKGASEEFHMDQDKIKESYGKIVGVLWNIPTLKTLFVSGTLLTFAFGAMAFWVFTFMAEMRGYGLDEATKQGGVVLVAASFTGVVVSGILADTLQKRHPSGNILVAGLGLVFGTPFIFLFILVDFPLNLGFVILPVKVIELISLGGAVFFLMWTNGPVNNAMFSIVEPQYRATMIAAYILIIHLLGDMISPPIVGILRDLYGFKIALLVLPCISMMGAFVTFLAMRTFPADRKALLERLKQDHGHMGSNSGGNGTGGGKGGDF